MRFVLKQSCCIACLMTCYAWGEIPRYLVNLEQEFWRKLELSATAKRKAVQRIPNPQVGMEPSKDIVSSSMKKWEILEKRATNLFQEGSFHLLNGPDEFYDLPVGLGLAMADRLILENEIELSDFRTKGKTYHFSTGDKTTREKAFGELYEKYEQTYMQDFSESDKKTLLFDLLNRYFDVEENLGVCQVFESFSLSSQSENEEYSEENPFISDSSSEM